MCISIVTLPFNKEQGHLTGLLEPSVISICMLSMLSHCTAIKLMRLSTFHVCSIVHTIYYFIIYLLTHTERMVT